jgi:hypothetical protein
MADEKLTISIDQDGRVTISNAEFEESVAAELSGSGSAERVRDVNIWKCR